MRRLTVLAGCVACLALLPASAVAANINVTLTADTVAEDDQCSLREAIEAAETNTAVGMGGSITDCLAGDGGNTVDFVLLAVGTYTLVGAADEDMNASGDIDITNGGDKVVIDGVANGAGVPQTTIQAPPMDRILEIHDPGTEPAEVDVQDVILQGGNPQGAMVDGGAIFIEDDEVDMTIGQSLIRNNSAPHYGGGIAFPNGSDEGPDLRIMQTEFSGNSADEGGGVYYGLSGVAPPTDYPLQIQRSAFVGNSAADVGGGVYIEGTNSTETLEVFNSTFSGNSATNGGGAVSLGGISARADFRFTTIAQNTSTTAGRAGGIQTDSNAHLIEFLGTIIAGNTALNCAEVAPGDLMFTASTAGYNLESANTCDLDPIARGGSGTDLIDTDPLLAPLATNAGPIQTSRTHGLYDTSPALNRVPRSPDNWCTSLNTNGETDQRSSPRPTAPLGLCDVGAFEGSVGPVPVTTPPVTTVVPDPTTVKKKCKKKKKKKKRSAAAAKKCKKKKKKKK